MIYSYSNFSSFSLFFSAEYTQAYLKKNYQQLSISDAEQKSYENCYPFIYYLEHGQVYYEQARTAPLLIKPILLFYGLVHLIKACILTVDPNYPETTSVLAHGVSTRKRKKQGYQFFQDEVKFQKTGLFPFVAEKLFAKTQLEGEKATMNELLMQIPELSVLFVNLVGKQTFLNVEQRQNILYIPEKILDYFHMSEDRFKQYFTAKTSHVFELLVEESTSLSFQLKEKYLSDFSFLKYNFETKKLVLTLVKDEHLSLNELLSHYLLLYNLSMIARYETEWWSELIKTMPTKDFPFIKEFLSITLEKGPFLVYQFLMQRR